MYFRFYSNVDIVLKKKFYDLAFSNYQRALGILENRKQNPVLWDLVIWELSTGTFTLAQHMIDHCDDMVSELYYCTNSFEGGFLLSFHLLWVFFLLF